MKHTLNYHHLQYFWSVAHRGSLTGAAAELRVAASALSSQIRQLEADLGADLFLREGRQLKLTEAGRMALSHADAIFSHGRELTAAFERGRDPSLPIRIAAVATLSRNFQESFLQPLLEDDSTRIRLVSGGLAELLHLLRQHEVDLILANAAVPPGDAPQTLLSRRVARQRVSFVRRERTAFNLRRDCARSSFLLPGPGSAINVGFRSLCGKLGVTPDVRAEVDDMAMLRLLARDTEAVAVVPPVVVRDELRARRLHDVGPASELHEDFYAITVERRFPHPLVERLFKRRGPEVLEVAGH